MPTALVHYAVLALCLNAVCALVQMVVVLIMFSRMPKAVVDVTPSTLADLAKLEEQFAEVEAGMCDCSHPLVKHTRAGRCTVGGCYCRRKLVGVA